MTQPQSTSTVNPGLLDSGADPVSIAPPNRANFLSRKTFLKDLVKMLGMEFIKQIKATETPIYLINRARILDGAKFIKDRLYQLEAIFAGDEGKVFELNYLFHMRPLCQDSAFIIQTQIDKTVKIPTLTGLFVNAEYHERNLFNRLGIKFEEKKITDDSDSKKAEELLCIPTNIRPPSPSSFNFYDGIYHPIHEKYNYLDVNIKKGFINNFELRDGWLYNKIQPKLETKNPFGEFSSVFDQITQNSTVHLHLAYYSNLEHILQTKITSKVN